MIRFITCLIASMCLLVAACSNDGDGDLETSDAPTETSAADDSAADAQTATETVTASPTPTPTREVDMDAPAFTEESTISTVGLDEVFFGMIADDAAAAADTAWEAEPDENPVCWFATPVNGPDGVSLMIWESTVERIDVANALIRTRSGAGVGSTAEELRALFGDRIFEEGPERYVFVPADEEDAEFRIIFDMVDGAVVAYRAGRLPMVEAAGCG